MDQSQLVDYFFSLVYNDHIMTRDTSGSRETRGRPRIYSESAMSANITVPFTPEQRRELTEFANRFNLPVSTFIRDIVLLEIEDMKEDLEVEKDNVRHT